MKEYEVYVPRNYNNGVPIEKKKLKDIKKSLANTFEGVTEIHLRKRGWWRMGDVLFRDKITIFRVLSKRPRTARKFLRTLKEELKKTLRQKEILIVEKDVKIL